MNWHEYHLNLADAVALKSKDRSTKVGAVIVGPENEIRSTGFNGFPRGVDDDVDERHERPIKYSFAEHAERNAVYNASRHGTPLDGCTIYLSWVLPCADCARAIIQAGIKKVVLRSLEVPGRFKESCGVGLEMMEEAGIQVLEVSDERVSVPIDLPSDLILQLAMEAHRRDMTLNDFMVEVVTGRAEEEIRKAEEEFELEDESGD